MKFTTIQERINYLKYRKINAYKLSCISTRYSFIEKDLVTYVSELTKLNNSDMYNTYLSVKKISENTLYKRTYYRWISYEDRVISNHVDIVLDFVKEAEKLIHTYNNIATKYDNPILAFNSKKIKPYIINTNKIIIDFTGG